jgi:hypothetical protein
MVRRTSRFPKRCQAKQAYSSSFLHGFSQKKHNNNSHNRRDSPRHSPSPARLPLAAAFILQRGTHLAAGTATPSPATCSSVGAPRRARAHLPDHRCRLHYGCRRSSGAMQPLITGRAAPAHYHPPSPPRPTPDLALHAPHVLGFAQSACCKHMFQVFPMFHSMLQVFHMNVAQVDPDIAYALMVYTHML